MFALKPSLSKQIYARLPYSVTLTPQADACRQTTNSVVSVVRPLKNDRFCAKSRKAKIITAGKYAISLRKRVVFIFPGDGRAFSILIPTPGWIICDLKPA